MKRFIADVPALEPLKLVIGLELHGRGDVQLYRVELPGPRVSKDVAPDAKINLSLPRARFNDLATKGHIKEWREAFAHGDVRATGVDQYLKLIQSVVERQEEKLRTRRAKAHQPSA